MSCYIMEPRALAALAIATEQILNMGFNYFGFDAPRALFDALEDCENPAGFYDARAIYGRLYALNARAYRGRYRQEADTEPPEVDFSGLTIAQPPEWHDHHATIQPWHYRLLKLMDCYTYQVDEDATAGDPLTRAMVELSAALMRHIVRNTDEYATAPWGRF